MRVLARAVLVVSCLLIIPASAYAQASGMARSTLQDGALGVALSPTAPWGPALLPITSGVGRDDTQFDSVKTPNALTLAVRNRVWLSAGSHRSPKPEEFRARW